MKFSLELILLFFVSVHGKINKCYVGGVDESNCKDIINESVLQKFYISNFGMVNSETSLRGCILNNLSCIYKQTNEGFDIPYKDFKHADSIRSKSTSSMNKKCAPKSLMRLLFTKKDDDENLLQSWNDVLDNGTDIYRLKFHNKLVNMYKNNKENAFTNIFNMLYIKSSYIAASIYFFINNQDLAYRVVSDGISFFYSVKNKLCRDQDIDSSEVITWGILNQSLKINIMDSMGANERSKYKVSEMIQELEENLENNIKESTKVYPCPYILLFRSYFLDEELYQQIKHKLFQNVDKNIYCCITHPDNNLFMMYTYLISAIKNTDSRGIMNQIAIENLIYALETPVVSIEDRLLNYKAYIMMKELYSKCIENYDKEENILYKDACDYIEELKQNGYESMNDILNKLSYMIKYDKKKEDIESYIIKNDSIDQKFVHNIVTMAIDMDTKSEIYKRKIKNVATTIQILENYANKHEKLININHSNDNGIEKNSIKKKLINAYKWLIELYAVLSDSSINYKNAKSSFKSFMSKANSYKIEHDLHLKYLIYKYDCKDVYKLFSWKNCSILKTDDWTLDSNMSKSKSINSNIVQSCQRRCSNFMHSIFGQPFINKTDLLIQLSSYNANTDFVRNNLKIALKKPVITPEDRYRNIEAHELYSMFLMLNNDGIYKKNLK